MFAAVDPEQQLGNRQWNFEWREFVFDRLSRGMSRAYACLNIYSCGAMVFFDFIALLR